ncbi:MAG: DUF4347 domain-containing protein [Bacteroidia bacterium]|nr:DUF4347 domain-containing protein [Bacteroidia bacterium]
MNNKIAREFSHKLILEELEARQLFSDGIEGVIVQELPPQPQPATYIDINSTTNSTAQSNNPPTVQSNNTVIASNQVQDGVRQELVFVDTDVKNYQELLNDIYNQSDAERNIQVILLDNNSDGIQQITQALSQYHNLDAVHLISHGSDGSVDIGNSPINFESLIHNQEAISAWGNSFTEKGDILIYGCDVAETQFGQSFIDYLSSLTNTDVAASDDATGNSALDGDWTLEFSAGSIETAVAPSAVAQTTWQGILATTTFQQGVSGYSGTTDTYLDSSSSGTNFGLSSVLQMYNFLGTQQSLVNFDLSSIPVGSIVTSASVTFTSSINLGLVPTVNMYKMLSPWVENTSTWNTLGGGVSTNDIEALSTADASWGALIGLGGTATFTSASVASTVQSWINNPANNNGWLLTAGLTSVQFYSSEEVTTTYRPQLSVIYTAPTPPSMDLDANNSSGATGNNYTTSFTEGGSAINVADTDATVAAGSNSISPNLSGMTVTISNLLDGSAESLVATTTGTSITASYNSGVLTLSGSDTAANYQTVLRTVTYNNTSNAPSTTSRVIDVVATDPYGGNSTAASTTITLTAVNDAPVLAAIGNQSVNELATLSFTASATDADLPADTLSFSLDAASIILGMSIDANTGLFSWTPGEAQGGLTPSVTITVTDSGTGNLLDSETFTISVADLNAAPVLAAIGNRSVNELATLSFTASATDADLPADTLSFSLDAASVTLGMSIDANTGAFSWTPGEAQGGLTPSVTITVTDSGTGNLLDSETFTISVADLNIPPTETNLSAAETYTANTALNLTNIVVTDVNSPIVTATLTLSDVTAGSLNTGTSSTVTSTFVAGVWTASGAIADVNTLLAGLIFTPTLNYNSNFIINTSVSNGVAAAVTGSKAMTGLPAIIGNINTVVTSMPFDIPHGSFNNTASIDSHNVNYVDITRSSNKNIFDKGASLSNKIILSAAVITPSKDVVIIDADQQIVTSARNSEEPQSMVGQPRGNGLANNFRDLLASSKADYTVDINRASTQSEEQALWQHIETMRHQIDDSELHRNSLEINVVVISTVTLTAGFVRWALRSGSLLASLLSSVPLLKRFDPLPIFIASKNSAASAKSENQEHLDDEILKDKVERLFSQSTRR